MCNKMEQPALQKAYLGAWLALLQPQPQLSRAAFGKALDGNWAAFHLKWLLAVSALQSSSRPVWNKLFFSPSQLGPD